MKITLETSKDLTPFNTMGIRAIARQFVSIDNLNTLQDVLNSSEFDTSDMFVLGGGSNILLTGDVEGLVLKVDIPGIEIIRENEVSTWVKIGAGENWHQFVLWSLDQNLGGVENLSLIPGTVGAAPMQNIGAYGVEIREVFESLEAVEIATGKVREFVSEECEFGYRTSAFKTHLKGKYIITSVVLRLNKVHTFHTSYGAIQETLDTMEGELSIRKISDAVIHIRQSKLPDPAVIGNAGSFFKNPVIDKIDFEGLKAEFPGIPRYPVEDKDKIKVPAGWLIEQCGWKGRQIGDAGVHKNQALVIVNYGNANGKELREIAMKVKASVMEKFGIELSPEVNII
jgi:UDP-N-acetylmuramate dehydrogenase